MCKSKLLTWLMQVTYFLVELQQDWNINSIVVVGMSKYYEETTIHKLLLTKLTSW